MKGLHTCKSAKLVRQLIYQKIAVSILETVSSILVTPNFSTRVRAVSPKEGKTNTCINFIKRTELHVLNFNTVGAGVPGKENSRNQQSVEIN